MNASNRVSADDEELIADLLDRTAPEYIDGRPSVSARDQLLMNAAERIRALAAREKALVAALQEIVEAHESFYDWNAEKDDRVKRAKTLIAASLPREVTPEEHGMLQRALFRTANRVDKP